MNHYASYGFWKLYEKLPNHIQRLADRNFAILKAKPRHPTLHLKKVNRYWSVRIGRRYRALAVELDEGLLWFWIGNHSEYDKLLR